MNVYRHLDEFKTPTNPVVTIGMFDGVHQGHQKIIQRLKEVAHEINGETVLLSFYPHPRNVLQPDNQHLRLLNSIDEKIYLLDKAGLDHMIIHPFDLPFSNLSAEEYIQNVLVEKLGVKKLIIGYDHHFGQGRTGTFALLKEAGLKSGFEVEEIPSQDIEDISISSTKIRKALLAGDLDMASRFLGYPYMLRGIVASGNQIGRTLQFPTANIYMEERLKLIPQNGVYAVEVQVLGKEFFGMLNIGNRPTFPGKDFSIEVHIFDFNQDIYGETIQVNLLHRVRDEMKFESPEALQAQLNKDQDNIKSILR